MAEEKVPPVKKAKPQYATVEQLGEMMQLMQAINAKLEAKDAEKVIVPDEASPVGTIENPGVTLNPEWRKIVDEILGPDFGIQVSFDKDGADMKFTIVVPKEKSNAPRDYLEYYKHDWRTISLNPAQTGVGVRQWCEKIKRNLGRSLIDVKK